MDWQSQMLIVGQIAAAGVLGGLIGAEREWQNKPAGLRTHMLVGAAAALLMSLGPIIVEYFAKLPEHVSVRADPIRIVQAIIIGVSFLGAGTIVVHRKSGSIEGLTTAASILLTTAIGITVALSQWVLAVSVTALSLIVLVGLRAVDAHIIRRRKSVDDDTD